MIKIIYAEKAKEGISREQFVRRWRKHGAYAMGYDDFWSPVSRYLHNNAVVDTSGFPYSQPDYDGVGELVFANGEDCSRSLSAPSLRDIALDADQFFSRKDLISLVCETHQLYCQRFAEIKVFSFLHRAPGVDPDGFFLQWESMLAELSPQFCAQNGVRQLASSRPLKPTPTRPVMAGSDFDVVVDLSFDTLEEARRGYDQWLTVIASGGKNNPPIDMAGTVTIVTHSSLQYDASHFGTQG